MVKTNELLAVIDASGMKKQFLAKELGISIATFWRKIRGLTEFKPSEIARLSELLGIGSLKERDRLFF